MEIPHWPRTPVDVGGRRFYLAFNLGALAAGQSMFDDRGLEANLLEMMPELTLSNMRILFACGLRKSHPELDYRAAIALVTFHAAFDIAAALRSAWRDAAPIPAKDADKKAVSKAEREKPLPRDQQWQQLWSLAVYDLRLSTEQFYDLTLGQLEALIRRHERATRDQEFLFAQLGSLTVNFSMARPEQPIRPRDLMPSLWNKPAAPQKRYRINRQAVAEQIRASMNELMNRNRHA